MAPWSRIAATMMTARTHVHIEIPPPELPLTSKDDKLDEILSKLQQPFSNLRQTTGMHLHASLPKHAGSRDGRMHSSLHSYRGSLNMHAAECADVGIKQVAAQSTQL